MTNQQLDKQLLLKTYFQQKKIHSANTQQHKTLVVWEVSYKGQNNALNYLTLDFKLENLIGLLTTQSNRERGEK